MVLKVLNPKTKRFITVNGTIYCDLEKAGVHIPLRNTRSVKEFEPVHDKKVKKVSADRKMKVDRSDVSWAEKKPTSTGEREKLLDKCGKVCFLIPEEKKFPICNKITSEKTPCEYNCKGLKAASSRAGEWKYENVLKNSKKLTGDLDCYKSKKEEPKKKPKLNKYFQKLTKAQKNNSKSFTYDNQKYIQTKKKNGFVVYKKAKNEKKK